MATTNAPPSPDPRASTVRRRVSGALAGIVLAALALGHGLFAGGAGIGAAWAASGPTGKARAAEALLHFSDRPLAPAARARLAGDALRRAPLHPQALSYLAMVAQGLEDAERETALIDAAARLGWQDEAVQRHLYNRAILADDPRKAMTHAEALLRQAMSADPLGADFAIRLANDRFRAEWSATFAGGGPWAEWFLARHGAAMPDAALAGLFAERGARAAVPPMLVGELVKAGRFAMAAETLAALRGDRLSIPRWTAGAKGGASGWTYSDGFAVTSDGALRRLRVPAAKPVTTLTGFPPGRYRLLPVGELSAPLESWRWQIACLGRDADAFTLLASGTGLVVPEGCPLQTLAVTAELAAHGGDPLPRLEAVPLSFDPDETS